MSKLTIILLALIIVGIVIGLYISYKMIKAQRALASAKMGVENSYIVAEGLLDHLDDIYPVRMVFLHHSVGGGILYKGGLRDSLLKLGVVIRGCTYGDEIGDRTDMNDWLPKFQNDMKRILDFKAHPNKYYEDGKTNDIIMFKSCFPNSRIVSEGEGSGNPTSSEKTIANYKATFENLRTEMVKYPNKVFIYMTAPPNVPAATTPENAQRAREFNVWLINEYLPKFKEETGLNNLFIYDLFNLLAGDDNCLKKEYRWDENTRDSHPNDKAKKDVSENFVKFFKPLLEELKNKQAGA